MFSNSPLHRAYVSDEGCIPLIIRKTLKTSCPSRSHGAFTASGQLLLHELLSAKAVLDKPCLRSEKECLNLSRAARDAEVTGTGQNPKTLRAPELTLTAMLVSDTSPHTKQDYSSIHQIW